MRVLRKKYLLILVLIVLASPNAFSQEKKYDFNFDVDTTDKIVCSELAYVSFPSIDWPTAKTLGRYSISPDNVAQLAWNNVPLQLVIFYHDGQLVDESKMWYGCGVSEEYSESATIADCGLPGKPTNGILLMCAKTIG